MAINVLSNVLWRNGKLLMDYRKVILKGLRNKVVLFIKRRCVVVFLLVFRYFHKSPRRYMAVFYGSRRCKSQINKYNLSKTDNNLGQ